MFRYYYRIGNTKLCVIDSEFVAFLKIENKKLHSEFHCPYIYAIKKIAELYKSKNKNVSANLVKYIKHRMMRYDRAEPSIDDLRYEINYLLNYDLIRKYIEPLEKYLLIG